MSKKTLFFFFICYGIVNQSISVKAEVKKCNNHHFYSFDIKNTIKFDSLIYDVGILFNKQELIKTYRFRNTGSTPILICSCQSSSGCLLAAWPSQPILPGQTGEIQAIYNAVGNIGTFYKNIFVRFDNGQEFILEIKGEVKEVPATIVFKQTELPLKSIRPDGKLTAVFEFKNQSNSNISILQIAQNDSFIETVYTKGMITTDSTGEIKIEMNDGWYEGYYSGMCRVIFSDGIQNFDFILKFYYPF